MIVALDHTAAKPLYQQLAAHLRSEILCGIRAVGARMPPEAEMMRQTGVSKGTVKAAYSLLREEGLLRSVRGSGTYVCKSQSRHEHMDPQAQVRHFFANAYRRGESASHVYQLFRQRLDQVYTHTQTVCAAMVDCNWESLHLFCRQLKEIPGLQVTPYLLSDLIDQQQNLNPQCNLVLTTQTHYPAMLRYAGRLGIDLAQLAIKETDQTIAALSKLPRNRHICIVYRSDAFLESVRASLSLLSFDRPLVCAHEEQLDILQESAAKRLPLILPPDYAEHTGAHALRIIERARKSGCLLIPFYYEVEQGSLIHLQRQLESSRKERPHGTQPKL